MEESRFAGISQLPRVAEGDRPSASLWNQMADAIEALYRMDPGARPNPPIEVVKLSEPMGPDLSDQATFYDVESKDKYHVPGNSNDLLSGLSNIERDNLTSPSRTVHDRDEVVPVFHHPQSGKRIPLNPRYLRFAMTYPYATDKYPNKPANCFPFKFVRIAFIESPGNQNFTISYLDSGTGSPANNTPDGYLLNTYDEEEEGCCSSPYIPVYTVVPVWDCIGLGGANQFFTHVCCAYPDESSSQSSGGSSGSSDLSSASSGGSSLSSGLSSLSSRGSSDSSGGSSGSSSRGSSHSSRGSSASSVNSSQSISASGCEGTEVEVVSSVTFDDATCELTVCTITICFAEGTVTYVTSEQC